MDQYYLIMFFAYFKALLNQILKNMQLTIRHRFFIFPTGHLVVDNVSSRLAITKS